MDRSGYRRRAGAFVFSITVHLFGGWLLWSATGRSSRPAKTSPRLVVEVELRPLPAPRPLPARPPPSAEISQRRRPGAHAEGPGRAAETSGIKEGALRPRAGQSPPGTSPESERAAGLPRRSTGLLDRTELLQLRLSSPDAPLASGDDEAANERLPGVMAVHPSADELAVASARLNEFTEDAVARARVRDGRDSYWQRLEDEFSRGFHVDSGILEQGSRPEGDAAAIGGALRSWLREAAAYGSTGTTAFSSGRNHLRDRGFRRGVSLDSPLSEAPTDPTSGAYSDRLVAHLLIEQAEDGRIERVQIKSSSGNRAYDDIALARARALGSGDLGAPPANHRVSLWAFETDFHQQMPVPMVGCALDDKFLPRECTYPLKKTTKSRVWLEAVY
jgi:hypothetical protein